MSAIRCHFDGKFIIPDEPVDLPVNKPLVIRVSPGVVFVDPPSGKPATVGELRAMGFVGGWKEHSDIIDSLEYAKDLRRRAEGRAETP